MLKILLLDAYDAASHQYWRKQLVQGLPQYRWTQLVLSPRYFNWRIRGNSLIWGMGDYPELSDDYDLIMATSMVDLACLYGLRPSLNAIPSVVYFHENQFAYPLSDKAQAKPQTLEPLMVNLYTALAASALAFNSEYNQQSFLQGVLDLLKKFPDLVPADVVARLKQKSCCLPVPLQSFSQAALKSERRFKSANEKKILLWNHRWEYDKGPERLLALVKALQSAEFDFRLHIVGQQFRHQPEVFADIKALLGAKNQLGQFGFVEDQASYECLLHEADVVISTALHDFQGLSILQACQAACLPLVPKRLAYPQWLAPFCYESAALAAGEAALALEAQSAVDKLIDFYKTPAELERYRQYLPKRLNELSWDALKPDYQMLIERVSQTRRP